MKSNFETFNLWNISYTWNAPYPRFTFIFNNTIIYTIPILFLLPASLLIWFQKACSTCHVKFYWYNILKIVICFILAIENLIALWWTTSHLDFIKHRYYAIALITCQILRFFSDIYAMLLIVICCKKNFVVSGVMFIYWALAIIGNSGILLDIIMDRKNYDVLQIAQFSVRYTLLIIQLILSNFCERSRPTKFNEILASSNQKINFPTDNSSVLSLLFFGWLNKIYWYGYRNKLSQTNILNIPTSLHTSNYAMRFCEECEHVRVFATIIRIFFWDILQGHVCKFLSLCFLFCIPSLLKELILLKVRTDLYFWHGLWYIGLLCIVLIMKSIMQNWSIYYCQTSSYKIKTALLSRIYQKALLIKPTEDVNMSLFLQKCDSLANFISNFPSYWSAPLQLIVILLYLQYEIGISSIAAMIVLLFHIPIMYFLVICQKMYKHKKEKSRDKRITVTQEIISNLETIKCNNWIQAFEKYVAQHRSQEVYNIKSIHEITSIGIAFLSAMPLLAASTSFIICTYITEISLTAVRAFTVLWLLDVSKQPLTTFAETISKVGSAWRSWKEVDNFLEMVEPKRLIRSLPLTDDVDSHVIIKNASVGWTDGEQPALRRFSIVIPSNSLIAIVGLPESGKSALIATIAGQMHHYSGSIERRGKIGYVPQTTWIQNATFQENVLFGATYKAEKYRKVLEACGITTSVRRNILDNTVIDAQTLRPDLAQRICIARTVYNNADIYLLDDPFSRIESQAAQSIFDRVLGNKRGLLRRKTRLVVTDNIRQLLLYDQIIFMKDGALHCFGPYSELIRTDAVFKSFIKTRKSFYRMSSSSLADISPLSSASEHSEIKYKAEYKTLSQMSLDITNEPDPIPSTSALLFQAFSTKESVRYPLLKEKELQQFSLKYMMIYIIQMGCFPIFCTLLSLLLAQVLAAVSGLCLSDWSDDLYNSTTHTWQVYTNSINVYVFAFTAIVLAHFMLIVAHGFFMSTATANCSKKLYKELIKTILRVKITVFEQKAKYQLERYLPDALLEIDEAFPITLSALIITVFGLFAYALIVSYVSPLFIVIIILPLILLAFYQSAFCRTQQYLRSNIARYQNIQKLKLLEVLNGQTIICAFQQVENFMNSHLSALDNVNAVWYTNMCSSLWMELRIDLIGAFLVTIVAILVTHFQNVSPGLTALAIFYALTLTSLIHIISKHGRVLCNAASPLATLIQYTELPQERALERSGDFYDQSNTKNTSIEFQNYSITTRDRIQSSLIMVNASIQAGEEVAIIGKADSGKDILSRALCRLIEPESGCIIIGDKSTNKMGLKALRSQISIVKQNPEFFEASIQFNLDPTGKIESDDIWRALEQTEMDIAIKKFNGSLNYVLSAYAQEFSDVQKLLLDLARAILRNPRILILDETIPLDIQKQDAYQICIRETFAHCTKLIITENLSRAMNCQKVLVVKDGKFAEFDTPQNLISYKSGLFHSMLKEERLI